MREREETLIITFATTTDAIAMERMSLKRGLPGRLIPVPREIAPGCGMAWKAPPEARERTLKMLEDEQLCWSDARVIAL